MADLRKFEMNGCRPFGDAIDETDARLREARAILLMMEQAFRSSADLANTPLREDITDAANLIPTIVADALAGASTLVALAQLHADEAHAARRSPVAAKAA